MLDHFGKPEVKYSLTNPDGSDSGVSIESLANDILNMHFSNFPQWLQNQYIAISNSNPELSSRKRLALLKINVNSTCQESPRHAEAMQHTY